MAHTIFGRGDTEGVRSNDLALLWCMVRQNRMNMNSGPSIAKQLESVAKASSRAIVAGGLIYAIARHFRVPLGDDKIPSSEEIDMVYLRNAGIINSPNSIYFYDVGNNATMLPNSFLTTVRIKGGLVFGGLVFSLIAEGNNDEESSNEEETEDKEGNEEEEKLETGGGTLLPTPSHMSISLCHLPRAIGLMEVNTMSGELYVASSKRSSC